MDGAAPDRGDSRHGGHADIICEILDGVTLYPLMAAAEQWSDPWFEPWKPAVPAVPAACAG
ncbi:hypothetical protein [Streptomyces scabiei]|uniref:hypothetical protein n=1 Tax=Streptomyces TaxID=1883 RepID=UPI0029BB1AFE|nr:hypothetical protein [Streptomyces scabiei]MDX3113858.1 hypothetical protein [Streptomyces scabiei]